MTRPTGKLADPQWRKERARKAANARTSLEYHEQAVADGLAELPGEERKRRIRENAARLMALVDDETLAKLAILLQPERAS